MKVFGIILLMAGLFFLFYVVTTDISAISPSAGFAPWAGIIVFTLGGVLFYKARKE